VGFAGEYNIVISGPGYLTEQKKRPHVLRKLWKLVQTPKLTEISIYHIIQFVKPIFKAITNGDNGWHIIAKVNLTYSQ
jgi:hypothetical protein